MKKTIVLLMAVFVLLAFCACGPNGPDITIQNSITFERIALEDLSDDIQRKVDVARTEQGYDIIDGRYLVVYGGEKPTAGYSIAVTEVLNENGTAHVTVAETVPPKDSMTAQVLTYPVDIVVLETDINDDVLLTFVEADNVSDTSVLIGNNNVESIEGAYVGQIDSQSVEVIVGGSMMAFRLSDTTKEQVLSIGSGDIIVFEYQQNADGQNVIISFGEQSIVVTYEGQIDPHSIEVIKRDSTYDVFQLSGDALEQAGQVETGDIIKILYTFNEYGQKVAHQLIKIEK